MYCIACDTEQDDESGTYFRSHGNYGSTVFDPMDGSFLDIVICDECLRSKAHRAECGRNKKPVICEGTLVGWARTPDRRSVEFNPVTMGGHDFDDVIVVDQEDVGTDLSTVEWHEAAVEFFKHEV